MNTNNIFTHLSKGNKKTENYFSEAFVYLNNRLLSQNPKFAKELLGKICGVDFTDEEALSLTTSRLEDGGGVDIKIDTPDKLILIESKIDSDLSQNLTEKYKEELSQAEKSVKEVMLITKWDAQVEEGKAPDRHLRWYEVAHILEDSKTRHSEEVSEVDRFLIDEFLSFMEEEGMTIEKVNWEFTNGVQAMFNLIEQLRFILTEAGLSIKRSAGQQYNGFDIKIDDSRPESDWIGIYYYDKNSNISLDSLIFEVKSKSLPSEINFDYPIDKVRFFHPALVFEFGKSHFFALSRNEQLEKLREFIQKGIDLVRSLSAY